MQLRGQDHQTVHYSVVIPYWDCCASLAVTLSHLQGIFQRLVFPYELICVEPASCRESAREFETVCPTLNVLRTDEATLDVSAALGSGVAVARGRVVIGVSAFAGIALEEIPEAIARLASYDLVMVRSERRKGAELLDLLGATAGFAGRPVHASDARLFIAGRRPSLATLDFNRTALRALPLVATDRGYRVGWLTLRNGCPPRCNDYRPTILDRLSARLSANSRKATKPRRRETALAEPASPHIVGAYRRAPR